MHGHGTKFEVNGDRYVGGFKDDLQDGCGILFNHAKQTKRQGEWHQGKRSQWLGQENKYFVS
jgi:hypothetical protein